MRVQVKLPTSDALGSPYLFHQTAVNSRIKRNRHLGYFDAPFDENIRPPHSLECCSSSTWHSIEAGMLPVDHTLPCIAIGNGRRQQINSSNHTWTSGLKMTRAIVFSILFGLGTLTVQKNAHERCRCLTSSRPLSESLEERLRMPSPGSPLAYVYISISISRALNALLAVTLESAGSLFAGQRETNSQSIYLTKFQVFSSAKRP